MNEYRKLMESIDQINEASHADRVEYVIMANHGEYVSMYRSGAEMLNFTRTPTKLATRSSKNEIMQLFNKYTQLQKADADHLIKIGNAESAGYVNDRLPFKIIEISYKQIK